MCIVLETRQIEFLTNRAARRKVERHWLRRELRIWLLGTMEENQHGLRMKAINADD
jgi:hypothetical protein